MYQPPVAAMPAERNAPYYKMDHKNRGLAVIFNHEHFEISSLKQRNGTKVDCESFANLLKCIGFKVEVYHDMCYKDIREKVSLLSSQYDHSDSDCFLMAVLSHGELGILFAKDTPYKPDSLWTSFTADRCPSLAGKPKMFFIQACQGDRLDGGVTLSRTETDGHGSSSYRIPLQADFLIAYSTVPGYYSWRNTTRGSWFIQALCEELEKNGFQYDMLTLLTFVCQRVALDYESNTPDVPYMHRQKQIPCITSMLTRLVKFTKNG
ncbi:caspase-1 isoform X2 [Agrilus planipennis]|nr:caspase-1 isoform X2 [Agrilus planipennis]